MFRRAEAGALQAVGRSVTPRTRSLHAVNDRETNMHSERCAPKRGSDGSCEKGDMAVNRKQTAAQRKHVNVRKLRDYEWLKAPGNKDFNYCIVHDVLVNNFISNRSACLVFR